MAGALEDLRYSLRSLGKARGFVIAAVLSLALGIGANTTIFTLLNAVLWRPLPVEAPHRLAAVNTLDPRNPGLWPCSYPNYRDYRDHNQVFSSLLLYSTITLNLAGFGQPQLVTGQIVSGNYFSTLGVNPVVGRGFLARGGRQSGRVPGGGDRLRALDQAVWPGPAGDGPHHQPERPRVQHCGRGAAGFSGTQ